MSAVIFDELARLSAAIERFELDCPAEWSACGEWVVLGEAVRAVEAAVAEAWPSPEDGLFDEPEEEPSPEALAFQRMIVRGTIAAEKLEASGHCGDAELAKRWTSPPARVVEASEIGMISESLDLSKERLREAGGRSPPGVIEIGLDWAVLDASGKAAIAAVAGEVVPSAGIQGRSIVPGIPEGSTLMAPDGTVLVRKGGAWVFRDSSG